MQRKYLPQGVFVIATALDVIWEISRYYTVFSPYIAGIKSVQQWKEK